MDWTREPERLCGVGFLLLRRFAALSFFAAYEPLRVVNVLSGKTLTRSLILSVDGNPVQAESGMQIIPDASIADVSDLPIVVVCSGFEPVASINDALKSWLWRQDQTGTIIGALGSGCHVLAECGLLKSNTVTMHWEFMPAFSESYPHVSVSQHLFEVGDRRFFCAGGTAGLDFIVHIVAKMHGKDLALALSEQFVHEPLRGPSDSQPTDLCGRVGVHSSAVRSVVRMMEGNLEHPLNIDELAAGASVSRRQLERLFVKHIGQTPIQFYLGLRIGHAQRLLRQTDMRVVDVATACGFNSVSHFSRSYRASVGRSPQNDRVWLAERATA